MYDSEPLRRAARERYEPEFRLSRSCDRTTKNGGRILSPESTDSMFDSSSDYEDTRYKDTLAFGKAMKKLRTVIKEAGVIYSGVLKEYDADVQSVKTYTPERILRQLWALKLDSVSNIPKQTEDLDQHAGYGNSDQDADIKKVNDSEDTLYEQLNHQIAQVMEALKQARVSTVGEKSSATVFKASERLKEKIDTTGRQILELFQRARDGSLDCEALLDELNGLYTLLEGNKKLYANEKEGENVESSVSS
ncbi:hypothetical protein BOTNAR_0216g00080 [Botryotinia narcissicola]|uniref:Uncharacterized protein n=1 Tax=Botryotinia narcissicola TaxID=278944 RepID=A0A4Z1IJD4_9HELO|nr:hypothetical protein BOTNAR_0216g00080 [Botryotinia narcissicola]